MPYRFRMSNTRPLVTVSDGDRIRQLREERLRLNGSEFARRIGIRPQSLKNIEAGRRSASLHLLARMARELSEPVDGLLKAPAAGGEDDEPGDVAA